MYFLLVQSPSRFYYVLPDTLTACSGSSPSVALPRPTSLYSRAPTVKEDRVWPAALDPGASLS